MNPGLAMWRPETLRRRFFNSQSRYALTFRVLQSILPLAVCLSCLTPASADTFILRNGARIQGEWLNRDEAPTRRYIVRVAGNSQLTLELPQVKEHLHEPAAIFEYERKAPAIPDTVQDHWQLAEWCRKNGLSDQRKSHLWRVIELDPDHQKARQALGFTERDGKWVTRKEYFEERGYVYYQGKWRLPQEVDLVEEQRELERLEREWFAKLKIWRGQFGTDHEATAIKSLSELRDPLAIKALAENLQRERLRRIRVLYVRAIAKNESPRAIEILTATALNDADPEIFHECVDRLTDRQLPGLAKALTEVLKDRSNIRVNRAAHILGRLGDRKAIPALTAALVTTHEVALPADNRTSATFMQPVSAAPSSGSPGTPASPSPGLGDDAAFSTGRQPKTAMVQIANQEVLASLVRLSGGQSFGFDQRAWRNWWATASK